MMFHDWPTPEDTSWLSLWGWSKTSEVPNSAVHGRTWTRKMPTSVGKHGSFGAVDAMGDPWGIQVSSDIIRYRQISIYCYHTAQWGGQLLRLWYTLIDLSIFPTTCDDLGCAQGSVRIGYEPCRASKDMWAGKCQWLPLDPQLDECFRHTSMFIPLCQKKQLQYIMIHHAGFDWNQEFARQIMCEIQVYTSCPRTCMNK